MDNTEMLKILSDEVAGLTHEEEQLRLCCDTEEYKPLEALESTRRHLIAITRALAIVKAAVKAKTTLRAYIDDFTMFDQLPIWRLLDALSEEVQTG